MNNDLLDATKHASYLLWEYMQQEEPLTLWKCVEDIACYFEANGILSENDIFNILRKNVYSLEYIDFMRNISYRIYHYTGRKTAMSNWFCAERLTGLAEWRIAILRVARILHECKCDGAFVSYLHNSKIKEYYESQL